MIFDTQPVALCVLPLILYCLIIESDIVQLFHLTEEITICKGDSTCKLRFDMFVCYCDSVCLRVFRAPWQAILAHSGTKRLERIQETVWL